MNEIFTRVSKAGTKSGDRRMTFVASDATRDSYGTVLMPEGWELDRFQNNPLIGYQHGLQFSDNPDAVIGKGRAYLEEGRLMVDVELEPEGMNDIADKVWKKLDFGTLNAVSVGFVPKEGRWGVGDEGPGKKNETYYYTRQELLEISIVAIPANPNALKNEADPEIDRLGELRQEALATEPEPPTEPDVKEIDDNAAREASQQLEMTIAMAETELLLLESENN